MSVKPNHDSAPTIDPSGDLATSILRFVGAHGSCAVGIYSFVDHDGDGARCTMFLNRHGDLLVHGKADLLVSTRCSNAGFRRARLVHLRPEMMTKLADAVCGTRSHLSGVHQFDKLPVLRAGFREAIKDVLLRDSPAGQAEASTQEAATKAAEPRRMRP